MNIEELYNKLCITLVPDIDKSDTFEGELLRALMKIEYRHLNDGDKFFIGYGCDTASQAATFLQKECSRRDDLEQISVIITKMASEDIEYRAGIEEIKAELIPYINDRLNNLTPNTQDMYDTIPFWVNEDELDDDIDDDDNY